MSSLTTGPFQNLSGVWAQLMKASPEQMAAIQAPDFLRLAAMNERNLFNQQAASGPSPPTQTVAQQVVDKAVGAPPAASTGPSAPPTQMESRGGYIHDYGVASLPYEANYGHGGIVSFSDGGSSKAAPEAAPGAPPGAPPEAAGGAPDSGTVHAIKRAWDGLSPIERDGITAAVMTGASFIPGIGAATKLGTYGRYLWGAISKYGAKLIKPIIFSATGIAAERALSSKPEDPATVAEPSDTARVDAATPEASPGAGNPFGGLANLANTPNIATPTLPAYAPQVPPAIRGAAQIKTERDASDTAYGVDPDYYKNAQTKNDAELAKVEAARKGVFSGQGMMDLGAALAGGESPNFFKNLAGSVSAYTNSIREGDQYARSRQDRLETNADLLRGKQRDEGRSDASSAIADTAASTAANLAVNNANITGADTRKVTQVGLETDVAKANADLIDRALTRSANAGIAALTYTVNLAKAQNKGVMTDYQRVEAFRKYSAAVLTDVNEALKARKIPADKVDAERQRTLRDGFNNTINNLGVW